MSDVHRYLKRRRAEARFVRESKLEGHSVVAKQDMGKFFRSRPGSANWKAHCDCGWTSSTYHYGETEALASAARHIKGVK